MNRFTFSMALLAILMMTAAGGGVEIVAHRGASHDAPENTRAAFELAWEQDADAIEGDFYLTSDDRIVAFHDKTTKRTTNADWPVAERTLADLRTLDAGRWKGERWAGQRIPTFAEVLDIVPPGKRILIEIKSGPEIMPALKEGLERADLETEQTIIICFDEQVIAAAKEQLPDMKAYWLHSFRKDEETGEWDMTPEELIETAEEVHADGVSLNANEAVDQNLADRVEDAGLELHVWTVNDPAVARRMVRLGVDSITTDRPAFLRDRLEEKNTAARDSRAE